MDWDNTGADDEKRPARLKIKRRSITVVLLKMRGKDDTEKQRVREFI